VNQSTQECLVADNFDVMLDAGTIRNAIDQTRDVTHIADCLEFLVPVELLHQRDHVDRTGRLGQIHHAGVNAAMGVERKVLRLQVLSCLVVGKIIQQDSAKNRPLGFHVSWQTVRETVVGSCQAFGYLKMKLALAARSRY